MASHARVHCTEPHEESATVEASVITSSGDRAWLTLRRGIQHNPRA